MKVEVLGTEAEISDSEEYDAVDVSEKSVDLTMSAAVEEAAGDHDNNTSAEIEDQMEEQKAEISNLEEEEEETSGGGVIDVSGKIFDFPMSSSEEDSSSVESVFVYKNTFNLIPSSVGSLKKLKTLKFFGNELNLVPEELNELGDLECLQVRACSEPGLGGLEIAKMESLKDLDLSRAPLKLTGLPDLSQIVQLKELKKLSLSHFEIRYLPSEIGCLVNLECLNLSFNKLKCLPVEITSLSSLIVLDVSSNKLIELPSGLCGLEKLQEMDVSNNRLASLGCLELELESMSSLKKLDLQNNRIRNAGCLKIPSGLCCNLEGNFEEILEGNELLSPEPEKKGKWRRKRKVEDTNTDNFQNPDLSVPENDESESLLKKKKNVVVDDVVQDDDDDDKVLSAKRRCDSELNDEDSKAQKVEKMETDISRKYRILSYCDKDDYLPDGFFDAGRGVPFMSLTEYEQKLHYSAVREVILVDREKDENLDAIKLRAQAFVSQFSSSSMSETEIASLLAMFVSDHFGGSDRSGEMLRMRKEVSGSNYNQPFVCTCATGNDASTRRSMPEEEEDVSFRYICESALQRAKERRNSVVMPIGKIQFGVCRHRALLMKYLCDRMEPRIQCELVRGFLDFTPHVWNVIVLERTGIRMIVDACRPRDIREETDSEYFSRYIPSTRMMTGIISEVFVSEEVICKTDTNTVLECQIGEATAVAKKRGLRVLNTTPQKDVREFEHSCVGEARMMSLLREHPCIVKYYGHQMSSDWDTKSNTRVLESTIFMEYIQGGSLGGYLKGLKANGEKRVPPHLALFIAREVSSALVELHNRHIIHRDIKSENILVDLDEKIVKLSDFDRATTLRASLHSCCIGHIGAPPPNVCAGSLRWMAPEVFRAMNECSPYGLEVDIWSFGCLLFELLTLEIPHFDLTESEFAAHLESRKRPDLTGELQGFSYSLTDFEEQAMMPMEGSELEQLKFLVSMYHWCTESNPADRPSADKLHKLLANASLISSSNSLEQEL